MPALSLSQVRKSYAGRNGGVMEALGGISLDVRRGEVVAVVGPSGCGKSSLLRILAGLDGEYEGRIDWTLAAAPGQLRSATVFQSDSTFPWLTVEQNLRIGLSGLALERGEAERRIGRYLALVGLEEFRRAYPHELSGGLRQRVAIARALAAHPLLLLMDEPLAALDAQTRIVMQHELLGIWRQTESTVVYITHDISEAVGLADRVVVMTKRPGRIRAVLAVPFGRERDIMAIRADPAFGRLEAEIWGMVSDEVGPSLQRRVVA